MINIGGQIVTNLALKALFIVATMPMVSTVGLCNLQDSAVKKHAESMEIILKKGLKKTGIPGCAFVVARKDKVIHVATYGMTTIQSNSPTPITNNTAFPVSSITKNITAVLVAALVMNDKIHWKDRVRKYLPKFFMTSEELSKEMTIEDLISHSSGYKHFSADTLLAANYDKDKILNAFRYLKQKPGEYRKSYGYQNVIFGIIGDVLEAATGEKYEDLLKKYVFDKVGMNGASAIRTDFIDSKFGCFKYLLSRFDHDKTKDGFGPTLWKLISLPLSYKSQHVVTVHSVYKGVVKPLPCIGFFQKFPATSGVNLTASDFAKLLAMLANGGSINGTMVISPKEFSKITSKISHAKNLKEEDVTFVKSRFDQDQIYYGIGMFNGMYSNNGKDKRVLLFHMGGIYGSSAFFAIDQETDVAVGVICNLGGVSQTLFAEYMVLQFLDKCSSIKDIDWLQAELNRKQVTRKRASDFGDNLREKNPTPARDLKSYCGTYETDIYGKITVSLDGGALVLNNGINKTTLDHVNGDIFSFHCKQLCPQFFDADEFVAFRETGEGDIEEVYITCFSENDSVFLRKSTQ
jgi:CubicO group peptidase (beta-lactamase class C family)